MQFIGGESVAYTSAATRLATLYKILSPGLYIVYVVYIV